MFSDSNMCNVFSGALYLIMLILWNHSLTCLNVLKLYFKDGCMFCKRGVSNQFDVFLVDEWCGGRRCHRVPWFRSFSQAYKGENSSVWRETELREACSVLEQVFDLYGIFSFWALCYNQWDTKVKIPWWIRREAIFREEINSFGLAGFSQTFYFQKDSVISHLIICCCSLEWAHLVLTERVKYFPWFLKYLLYLL